MLPPPGSFPWPLGPPPVLWVPAGLRATGQDPPHRSDCTEHIDCVAFFPLSPTSASQYPTEASPRGARPVPQPLLLSHRSWHEGHSPQASARTAAGSALSSGHGHCRLDGSPQGGTRALPNGPRKEGSCSCGVASVSSRHLNKAAFTQVAQGRPAV